MPRYWNARGLAQRLASRWKSNYHPHGDPRFVRAARHAYDSAEDGIEIEIQVHIQIKIRGEAGTA
jgi:hypothetical protein